MTKVTIIDLPNWRVVSYGNGLAYSIQSLKRGEVIFLDRDDAAAFRDALKAWEERDPNALYSRFLTEFWLVNEDAATPIDTAP